MVITVVILSIFVFICILCIIGLMIWNTKLTHMYNKMALNQQTLIDFEKEQYNFNQHIADAFSTLFGQKQQIMHDGMPVVNDLGKA